MAWGSDSMRRIPGRLQLAACHPFLRLLGKPAVAHPGEGSWGGLIDPSSLPGW